MINFGIQRTNLEYIENLYQIYQKDPHQVDSTWQIFFQGMEFKGELKPQGQKSPSPQKVPFSLKEIQVYKLIQAYRDYGHLEAHLNPLSSPKAHPSLSLEYFGLENSDRSEPFQVGSVLGMKGATLEEILTHLKKSYCSTLALQVSHTSDKVRQWFYKKFEENSFQLNKEQKTEILHQLCQTEALEKFLHTRFVGAKRFSIEGADSLIPQLEHLVSKGVELGVEDLIIGMAHRGRLNVLVNFMDRAVQETLAQFDGHFQSSSEFNGDVKYHLGYSTDKKGKGGENCHISLAFNPSHLEAVNPVVCGMARAKQRVKKDTEHRKKVIPLQIHGDAAFSGQGVVSETLQLSKLKGYTVGGSIHIIIDNQLGFTTQPDSGRSSLYPSDMAKSQQIPILHVNGDDPESCVQAMDLALDFRQNFGNDVLINLVCYRRFGHNEGDEPSYTQPLMYQKIKNHPTPGDIYEQKLVKEGLIQEGLKKTLQKKNMDLLQTHLDKVRRQPPKIEEQVFGGLWSDFRRSEKEDFSKPLNTGSSKQALEKVGQQLTALPSSFTPHPKLKKLLNSRTEMTLGNRPLDWGMAELLAYGSLIEEGYSVRISGQDCIRGTFSHRHSCFFDCNTGEMYNPLRALRSDKEFCVYNSSLSEMAVLGFEYGNSSSDPTFLTIWEAQFGDFANGAQIIIDQFLASGEEKWMRMSGLTLFLPHGYEGQGPEHSSARLERFLQLCAQNNMQIVQPTAPQQLFHLLRRQMKRPFRLPLITMTPKSLLRHPKVNCSLEDLSQGHFQEVLIPQSVELETVERIALVSGKLYYDLEAHGETLDLQHSSKVALIRMEQLYPYPSHQVEEVLKKASQCKSLLWVQEEPQNMGAWTFIKDRIGESMEKVGLKSLDLTYVGRKPKASPATGLTQVHLEEQKFILEEVFEFK